MLLQIGRSMVSTETALPVSNEGGSILPPGAVIAALQRMQQSVLEPAGPQAARIDALWWFLLAVAAGVLAAFVLALALAVWRGTRRPYSGPPDATPAAARERAATKWVAAATAVTVLILLGFTIASYLTGRGLGTLRGDVPLRITVTANQWWWDIEYEDTLPFRRLRTANEIHIPVGRRVVFRLRSNDVIHSFWVPNLHGKRDLTPGHEAFTWLQADRPGVYRGQCAEFCGHGHARMAFLVVAVLPDEFDRWYEAQLQPAAPPRDSLAVAGQGVFVGGPCSVCHAVAGTPAAGRAGPDLTHLASRRTIAAGTLPNTRGHLAGWVLDPQSIKPGVHMPPSLLAPGELRALLQYLDGLR